MENIVEGKKKLIFYLGICEKRMAGQEYQENRFI